MNFSLEKQATLEKLKKCGVPVEQAEKAADVMTTADVYGVTTHGTNTLNAHLDRIKRGGYNLRPDFEIQRQTAAFAVVDGDNALGFVSADHCMQLAVEKAKEVGVFHVFSKNNNTFGPAFYYPLKAAQQGMIGILFSNSPAQMPPYGGKEKLLGTNPFSAVIPVPGQDPIIIDMAMSVVAKSKFKEYKLAGKELPDGWAMDEDGTPTNDPDAGIRGLILPMGGYKGYCLAMLVDLLAGVVSGAAYLNKVGRFYSEEGTGMNVGFCCIAIDPYAVIGEEYDSRICDFVETIRASDTIPGEEISIPGDRKHRAKRKNDGEQ
ncbi:MAG: Ldh family oxidoreductase [Oscillospiraceae bacterium]|nr:Ldh family oxidoreductase [Oscillospiraceae bacterium]